MLHETDETYRQINIEDYFERDVKPNLFAVSRVFAEARKQMNLAEFKAFAYALANIRWKDPCPDVLYMDKKTVAKLVGINSDSDHLSQDLKHSIGQMPTHSYLEFSNKDSGEWLNGYFVTSIGFFKNRIRIRMNQDYLGLFGNLDGTEHKYITLWSEDIYKMHTERAIKFYELLRENSDTQRDVNYGTVGIKKFKELFNIPKDGEGSYMRKNGHFDRYTFEKRVIDPICADLGNTAMIQLILQPDGKYYTKIKRGNRVIAYAFQWAITMHPKVATAPEVKEIQDRVDKNPEVLKVAKDILKGEKKQKAQPKKNSFKNFHERDNDYELLEKQLLASQKVKMKKKKKTDK